MLVWLVVQITLSLGLLWRADPQHYLPEVKQTNGLRGLLLQLNNVMLCLMLFTVALATLYPLVLQVLGLEQISIGAPYFNLVMRPMLWLMLVGMAVVPFSTWRALQLRQWPRGVMIAAAGLIGLMLSWFWLAPGQWFGGLTVGLALWMVVAMWVSGWRVRHAGPRAWAMPLAHGGFAVLILALVVASHYSQEQEVVMALNDEVVLAHHTLRLIGVEAIDEGNYQGQRLQLVDIYQGGFRYARPELRYFVARDSWQPKADIGKYFAHDLMVVVGSQIDSGHWALRIYYKPLIRWALVGVGMMLLAVTAALRTTTGTRERATQVRNTSTRGATVRAEKTRSVLTSSAQARSAQTRSAQTRSAQARSTQVRSTQVEDEVAHGKLAPGLPQDEV